MINNKPMFPGKHYLDQICKIQEVLGSPVKQDLSFITNPKAELYVSSLPARPTVAWTKIYPSGSKRSEITEKKSDYSFLFEPLVSWTCWTSCSPSTP